MTSSGLPLLDVYRKCIFFEHWALRALNTNSQILNSTSSRLRSQSHFSSVQYQSRYHYFRFSVSDVRFFCMFCTWKFLRKWIYSRYSHLLCSMRDQTKQIFYSIHHTSVLIVQMIPHRWSWLAQLCSLRLFEEFHVFTYARVLRITLVWSEIK